VTTGKTACLSLLLLAVTSAPGWSQNAEALYQAGAYRLAADSFIARAEAAPGFPAHWYNAGNALYRAGDQTGARVAWLRAARALPRDGDIRRALDLVEAPDATSAAATDVAIVTPGEVLAIAAALWVLGWALAALRRPLRHVVPTLLLAVVVALLGWSKAREYRRATALVRYQNTALRLAPIASASTRRAMNAGTSVQVLRDYAGWVLVKRGNDQGWVQRSDIISLSPRSPLSAPRVPEEG
jgi:tetratricopeptide (TPR) repeat protein